MRNSKSIFLLCCIILFSMFFSLSSCSNNKLEKIVKEANNQCPIAYNLFTANSFKCEDKTVVINYLIDEDKIEFGNLKDETMYNIWRLFCIDESSQNDKNLINTIASSGYGIKCLFKGSKSQRNITLNVSNDQLKNYKALTQEEIIKNFVELTKSIFPKSVDQITKIIDFKIEKDKIIYVYEIDESNFDISKIENDSNYKNNGNIVIGNELSNNTLTGVLYKLVIRSGRGICHQYIGKNTGKKVEINFSNDELMQIASAKGLNE